MTSSKCYALLSLAGLMLFAHCSSTTTPPEHEVELAGKIDSVYGNPMLPKIRVTGTKKLDGVIFIHDTVDVNIVATTLFDPAHVDLSALHVGQNIRVIFDGAVLRSSPVQVVALKVFLTTDALR